MLSKDVQNAYACKVSNKHGIWLWKIYYFIKNVLIFDMLLIMLFK